MLIVSSPWLQPGALLPGRLFVAAHRLRVGPPDGRTEQPPVRIRLLHRLEQPFPPTQLGAQGGSACVACRPC